MSFFNPTLYPSLTLTGYTKTHIGLITSPPQSDAYNTARQKYQFTASQIPNIFGYGYTSRQKYYRELTGLEEPTSISPFVQELVDEGQRTEPLAADIFGQVYDNFIVLNTGLWPHPYHPWLAASPDRVLVNHKDPTQIALLEIKTRTMGAPPYSPTDVQFVKFWLQMQIQLQCTQVSHCFYWGFSNCEGMPAELAIIRRDDKVWKSVIEPGILAFKAIVDNRIDEDMPRRMSPQYKKEYFVQYQFDIGRTLVSLRDYLGSTISSHLLPIKKRKTVNETQSTDCKTTTTPTTPPILKKQKTKDIKCDIITIGVSV